MLFEAPNDFENTVRWALATDNQTQQATFHTPMPLTGSRLGGFGGSDVCNLNLVSDNKEVVSDRHLVANIICNIT